MATVERIAQPTAVPSRTATPFKQALALAQAAPAPARERRKLELVADGANDLPGVPPLDLRPPPPPLDLGTPPPVPDLRQAHLERSEAAVALIERIQVFLRHGERTVLSLTLDSSLGARVEIERLAQGLVAVTLIGHRGPPPPECVSRVREELVARGLKVGAISVA